MIKMMDKQLFVELITKIVRDAGVEDCINLLSSPPGKKPPDWLVEISNWFNNLGESDREMVLKIIKFSMDTGIFGFFCVLDGVRKIDEDNGHLTLLYSKENSELKINDSETEYLHEIFNSNSN